MSISQRLLKIRKTYDCTQAEFAKMLDTNGQSIADVENDKKKIGIALLEKLHTKLSINLNWLVSGTGKMKIDDTTYFTEESKPAQVSEPLSEYAARVCIDSQIETIKSQKETIEVLRSKIEELKAKCGISEKQTNR